MQIGIDDTSGNRVDAQAIVAFFWKEKGKEKKEKDTRIEEGKGHLYKSQASSIVAQLRDVV
ncbi:MAG: hypothetical protein N838_17175 [Thiohalocapsa sp. PB-PSB1]|nr:MAG: hypothetical protein N838_17175 [Thiohalocapsa sp. PB-PSB1]